MSEEEKKLHDVLYKYHSVVDPNLIVKIDNKVGSIYIGNERADEGRLANLRAEAEFLLASDIWKVLYETPKELAQQAMFVNGESLDDLKKGRAMLYTLSVQKNIVEMLRKVINRTKIDKNK